MIKQLQRAASVALKVGGLVLIVLFFFGLWSMGGSHTYYRQAQVYLDGAQQVLIAHGLCQNKNDCIKRQILFGDGGAVRVGPFELGGVQLYVYEVSSPEVVGDLVKTFGEIYKKQKGPRLLVHVYETRHQESKTQFAKIEIE